MPLDSSPGDLVGPAALLRNTCRHRTLLRFTQEHPPSSSEQHGAQKGGRLAAREMPPSADSDKRLPEGPLIPEEGA